MFESFLTTSEKERQEIEKNIKEYILELYNQENELMQELREKPSDVNIQNKYFDIVQQIGGAHTILECLEIDVTKLHDEWYNLSK